MIRAAALVLVTVLVVVVAYLVPHPQNEAKPPLHCGPVTAAWYVPPPSMFGQYNVSSIIHSAYWNESNLLGGNPPVDDIDMMHPWQNQKVKLPGDSRDRYYYVGAEYIQGSGWVQEYSIGIGGGRFAFLHMQTLPGVTPPQAEKKDPGTPRTCVDQTVASVAAIQAPGISLLKGGTYVGWSGYPTWSMYANGSPGFGDAHLCIALDSASVAYFYHIATRGPLPRPRPKKFNLRRWNEFRVQHHRRSISPYYKKHLSWIASVWWPRHANFYGIKSSHYYGKTHGYTQDNFRFGTIRCWPSYHACRVSSRR